MTLNVHNQVARLPSALTRRGLLKAGLGLTGMAGVLMPGTAAYAAAQAATDLVITDYRPVPPNWPDSHRLSITVIADLHAGGPNMGIERVRQVVDAAQALQLRSGRDPGRLFRHPPIYNRARAACGLGGGTRPPQGAARRLCHPRQSRLVDATSTGVRGALGRRCAFRCWKTTRCCSAMRGRRFWLAGLGDQLAYWLGPNRFRGVDDLPGTLAKVTTDDPVILLVHEPDIFTQVPQRVALTLAGHTHGGQIKFAVHAADFGRRRNTARASPMATSSSAAAT